MAAPAGAAWMGRRGNILGLNPALPARFSGLPRRGHLMPQFARRIGRAKPSAIMEIAQEAKRLKGEGRDNISFATGVPNLLPGEQVADAARDALAVDIV